MTVLNTGQGDDMIFINCVMRLALPAAALLILPCNTKAQVGSEHVPAARGQALSSQAETGWLSTAIEEIRRNPFYATRPAAGMRDLLWSGLNSGTYSTPYWSSPGLDFPTAAGDSVASNSQIFWTTIGLGVPVYLATGAIVFACLGFDLPTNALFCNRPVFVAVPILGLAGVAHAAGASFPRALIGSALGGAAAVGMLHLTGVEPFSAGGLGLLVGVHASVTTLASVIHFRRRPR